MVLHKGENTPSEDDDIVLAPAETTDEEVPTGLTEEGGPTGLTEEGGATGLSEEGAAAAAPSVMPSTAPGEGSSSPSVATQPPGPSPGQAESPLPPRRTASNVLAEKLAELNRERDVLRDHLHPINRPLLERWSAVQRRRDYLLRANFCETSNDLMLVEVRRVKRVVTHALQLMVCPSYVMGMFRNALQQVLNAIPGAERHMRTDNPHADFEGDFLPPRRRPVPTDSPHDPRWNSYLRNNHPLFNASLSMYQNIPELDYYGLGPPPDTADSREEAVGTRRGSSSLRHDAPVVSGEETLLPGDQRRVGSPTVVPSWNRSGGGESCATRSTEDHLLEVLPPLRRRDRRRVRSADISGRHISPEPLRLGDTVAAEPPVVVVAGHRLPQRWVSPSLLEDRQEPLSSSSNTDDSLTDVTSPSASPASIDPVGTDNLLNGGANATNDHILEPPVDVELPPLPLPVLPPEVLEQQQQQQQQEGSHGSTASHPDSSPPMEDSSSAARTRPIIPEADRHFSYSQAEYPYREPSHSSSFGSPHLIFSFTDEQELGIRPSLHMITPLDESSSTTSSTDHSRDEEEPSDHRRTKFRKRSSSKGVEESRGACAETTDSSTTDTTTSTSGTDASTTGNRPENEQTTVEIPDISEFTITIFSNSESE
ncbi:uncharacterized protein [Panulirus ornatus]|uniref:uncharacterized protein isoform X2 n=1 Tax=Panulirus ornatus TaxID=150431 RepID=UPI003A89F8BA